MIFNDSLFKMNSLFLFGLILIIGILGGRLAQATRFFPRVSGYLFIGFLFGPHILGVITNSALTDSKVFIEIAVGLVLFQLGQQLKIRQLNTEKKLIITGIVESVTSFLIIFSGLLMVRVEIFTATLIAIIGVSSSPALTLLLASKHNVGMLMRRSLTFAAINNIMAFCFFMAFLPFLQVSANQMHFNTALLDPAYRVLGSLFLGGAMGLLMIRMGSMIGKGKDTQFILLVGSLILTIGMAKMLHVSLLISPLILGLTVENRDKNDFLASIELGPSGEIFFIVLFVLTGAKLHIDNMLAVGGVALIFLLTRAIGKCLPVYLLSREDGLNKTQSYALGVTLLPMAGMAIGLLNTASEVSSNFTALASSIVLASIAIIEIISPILTISVLRKTGEIPHASHCSH
ncbi:MAG: cation:proton antiporter [Pseudomonadota bacterium]|nr:cation:proton antiporter [Pseudomonadota bacterium]